jgi:hypothetical protein
MCDISAVHGERMLAGRSGAALAVSRCGGRCRGADLRIGQRGLIPIKALSAPRLDPNVSVGMPMQKVPYYATLSGAAVAEAIAALKAGGSEVRALQEYF